MKFTPLTVAAFLAVSVSAADKNGFSGMLSTLSGGLKGDVTVVNSTALMITNYSVDPAAPALYWWGSKVEDLPKEGFRVSNHHVTEKANDITLMVALDNGKTTDDFVYFGLYCETLKANFGQTKLVMGGGDSSDNTTDSGSKDDTGAAMGRNSAFAAAAGAFLTAGVFVANML